MTKYLIVLGVLFWAAAGMAEELTVSTGDLDGEDMIFVVEDSGIVWVVPEEACIYTELCGDRVEGSDVRCIRVKICGEPIR
jgi:hypothetical protein